VGDYAKATLAKSAATAVAFKTDVGLTKFELGENATLTAGVSAAGLPGEVAIKGGVTLGGFNIKGTLTVEDGGSLTVPGSLTVTGSLLVDGGTLDVSSGTLGGAGKIKASAGTIKFGTEEFTTTGTGVTGTALAGAITALETDMDKLRKTDIDLSTGGFAVSGTGMGTVALATANTAAAIKHDADPAATADKDIVINSAFNGGANPTSTTATGTLDGGTFTLSIAAGNKLSLSEGAECTGSEAKGVVSFSGVKLQNNELISPELTFDIGVSSLRAP
jgi:hypothetical protein